MLSTRALAIVDALATVVVVASFTPAAACRYVESSPYRPDAEASSCDPVPAITSAELTIHHIPFWDMCYGQWLGLVAIQTARGPAVGYGLEIRVIGGRLPFTVPSTPVWLREGQYAQFPFSPPYLVRTRARVTLALVNARGERSAPVELEIADEGAMASPLPDSFRWLVVLFLEELMSVLPGEPLEL